MDDRKKLWVPSATDYVCSKHFKPTDYSNTKSRSRLRSTAIPSVFPHNMSAPTTSERTIRYVESYAQVPAIVVTDNSLEDKSSKAKLRARLANVTKDLRNTGKREHRLREMLGPLKREMLAKEDINEELSGMLDEFKGQLVTSV